MKEEAPPRCWLRGQGLRAGRPTRGRPALDGLQSTGPLRVGTSCSVESGSSQTIERLVQDEWVESGAFG